MESSAAEAGPEEQLRSYVPELLLIWPVGVAFQTLTGTMVSADVAGFTSLSERLAGQGREGAEELSILINGCFHGMTADCAANGGDVLKFGGDSLLVFFDGDGHTERACRAAIAMRRTIRTDRRTGDGKRVRLVVSTGVHSGEHTFYVVHNGHAELVVTGPGTSATVAAESAAQPGEILLSNPTAAMLPQSWLGEVTDDGVQLRRTFGNSAWAPRGRPSRSAADFVPLEQQAQILAGAINEHRQVSIGFVEFADTDHLASSELAGRLQELASSITEVCDRYGVFWLTTDVSFNGGRFIVTAGAPISRGGDEDRLLRAIRDVIDADPGLSLRAGVNRGFVFAGALGSDRRRTYTTLGDAMNLAARLMTKAGRGEIVASRPIIDWASSEIEYTPLEPFLVKGKTAPIHAGKMGRVIGRRSDLDRVDTELCGRRVELRTLLDRADAAIAGRGSVSVIAGEPGIGKSRLALEVLRQRTEFSIAFARCQPYDRLAPFSVAEPLLRSMIGIDREALPAEAGAALIDVLHSTAPELNDFASLIAQAIGAEVAPTEASRVVDGKFRRTRTLQLLVQLIQQVVVTPTALIIDDINLADDATRELVQALIEAAGETPLMVLATSVPDETLQVDPIQLGPLTESDVTHLVDELLGERVVSNEVVRAITSRSAGNPLFVGELVRSLAEDPHAPMPESLEALVSSRVDALEPVDRQLLRQASVLGTEVDIMLLGRITEDRLIRRQDRWERLSRFLEWAAPGVVRFRYDTYWRVVYGGLSFTARRAAHRKVIEILEVELDPTESATASLLAAHAERAGDSARTWKYATVAAESAASNSMEGAAARLYEIALTAKASAPAGELAGVAEHAATTFEHAGAFNSANLALKIALSLCTNAGDRARLLRIRGEVAERQGDSSRAARWYRQARALWRHMDFGVSVAEQAHLSAAEAGLAYRQARYSDAWNLASAAFAQAGMVDDPAIAARAGHQLHNLSFHIRMRGHVVTSPDVIALYRRAGDKVGEARHLNNRAVDLYFEGEWEQAARLYREVAELCVASGDVVYEATALNNIAEILSDQGRYSDADPLFRTANRTWQSVGFATGIALAEANLGRLATRTKHFERAEQLLQSALIRFRRLDAQAFVDETDLRILENRLRAADPVTDVERHACQRLAASADLDANLVVYASRLLAESFANFDNHALAEEAVTRSVEGARTADLPFELAQSLVVRASLETSDRVQCDSDLHEAAAIFDRLGCISWPRSVDSSTEGGSVMVEQAIRRDC